MSNFLCFRSVTESGLKYGAAQVPGERKVPQAELMSNGIALTDFWDFLLASDHGKSSICTLAVSAFELVISHESYIESTLSNK